MSTFSGNRTIKLWTCCQCRENGISMSLGECPKCEDHSRCYDCDVKSHAASDIEIEEENLKIVRSAGGESSSVRSRGQPESSREAGNVTISSGRVVARSTSTDSPSARSDGQPNFEPETSKQAGNVTISPGSVLHNLPSGRTAYLTRMSFRTLFGAVCRTQLTIRVAVICENDPVYVLREHDDADLIAMWNETLPYISQDCKSVSQNLVSIHLFRIGKTEESSIPTIIVNTKGPLLNQEKEDILYAVSLQGGPGSFPDACINSDSIQLVFRQSRLRRSVDTSGTDEPPICEPRNRHFNTLPSTGDSIGIARSIRDTATLGCYLIIGDEPFILTVDHLMAWRSPTLSITHISEQDQHALTIKALNAEVSHLRTATEHSCPECDFEVTERVSDHPSLHASYLLEMLRSSNLPSCSFLQHLKEWHLSPERPQFRSHVVGRSCVWSGRRCRTYENISREMDWAIFRVENTAPLLLVPKLLRRHRQAQSDFGNVLTYIRPGFGNVLTAALNIRPGAFVVSIGRTSGYQTGKISTTLSAIFHEEYVTQEWCVIKRAETSVEEWVEGGIGVEGDSGAIIVDEMTKEIYGMLWGRTGDGAATATIFTPLREIFEDIKSHSSYPQRDVGILKGQQFPKRPLMETGSLLSVRELIPTVPISVQPFEMDEEKTVEGDTRIPSLTIEGQLVAPVPTAPISIQLGETEEDNVQPFEQAFSSLSLTWQSSTDLVRHLPFKRYRRHSRSASDQDIGLGPATPREEREDNVESKSWPGSHTYLRYALGDQG